MLGGSVPLSCCQVTLLIGCPFCASCCNLFPESLDNYPTCPEENGRRLAVDHAASTISGSASASSASEYRRQQLPGHGARRRLSEGGGPLCDFDVIEFSYEATAEPTSLASSAAALAAQAVDDAAAIFASSAGMEEGSCTSYLNFTYFATATSTPLATAATARLSDAPSSFDHI